MESGTSSTLITPNQIYINQSLGNNKKYINLKNRIIYYLNDVVGLEQSLKNDKDLIKFIKYSTLFGSIDNIIKAVKNNEFVLIGKKYNEEIDSPAFKYEKSDAELIDTTLLMFGLKVQSKDSRVVTSGKSARFMRHSMARSFLASISCSRRVASQSMGTVFL